MCVLPRAHIACGLGLEFLNSSFQNICCSVLFCVLREASETHTGLNWVRNLSEQRGAVIGSGCGPVCSLSLGICFGKDFDLELGCGHSSSRSTNVGRVIQLGITVTSPRNQKLAKRAERRMKGRREEFPIKVCEPEMSFRTR